MPSLSLNIKTVDAVVTSDRLTTYKPWFNGAKKFFMVKALPPHR